MSNTNSDIVQEFLIESFEALGSISDEITTYEKNPNDKDLLNSIFRKVHTLKGSASFLGLKKLQEITHAAESVLDFIRDDVIHLDAELIDVFLECFDSCLELLKSIEETTKENDKNYGPLARKLTALLEKSSNASGTLRGEGSKVHIVLLEQSAELPKTKIEPVKLAEKKSEVKVEKMEKSVEKVVTAVPVTVTPAVVKAAPQAASGDHDGDGGSAKSGGITDSVVRVNVQLLDKIMNVVGELVLNRNQILQFANSSDSVDLNRLSQQLNMITTELQNDIMTTRMQPVGSVLSKFERIIRDLARSQNKKIKLEIIGKETELDKTLLEAIKDPLTHLIRNSVDHGVELPEKRKSKGKNEEGKIVIKSYHEGGQVTIEISDDGNGINPQIISDKAVQKGLYTLEQVQKLTPKQVLNIIFLPGFSTAEQVTNISGRGVGMDVVKSNIEKIGGSVDVSSNLGFGSVFKLRIPLTLAIVSVIVVQSEGETFAIPQVSLVELVRLENDNSKSHLEVLHGSEFFRLRGNLIPVFRLSESLHLDKKATSAILDDGINIVILNSDGRIYGLIVDAVLDTEEIVVKPLSNKFKDLTCFAGATIMGDGKVALIVDAQGFFNTVDKGHGQAVAQLIEDVDSLKQFASDEQEILLCGLGDQRNYAIPLMLVSRLEEFQSSQIEWTGEQAIIKYGNIPMPLVNVEKTLKLKGYSLLESVKNNQNTIIPCVVVKIRNQVFGFVVDVIRDIAISEGGISSDSVDREGLLGTIFVTQKTITLLDMHGIVGMQKLGKSIFVKKDTREHGKILLVEDSPLYRKVVKDYLDDNGYEVTTSINGQEAMAFLNSDQHFDLIITDIEMPVMDGWEFSKEVRASVKNFSKIPIIALSTRVSTQDREKGIAAGFNQHLEKLNKLEVLSTVNEYTKNQ
jgi:two-component system chemotaxis sensor kinase CheA